MARGRRPGETRGEAAPGQGALPRDEAGLLTALAMGSPPPPTVALLLADALPLVDRSYYEILAEHARGGLGRILRARDRRTGRMVAIKEMQGSDAGAEARFLREARLTAMLQHPAIVPVYEVGCWPSGRPFYAMKLVEGRSLDEIVAAAADVDDRLRLVPHVLAVAEALAYAHSQGIIHRDLKPENVLVGPFGETVVIDWGLAKQRGAPDLATDGALPAVPRDLFTTEAGAAMGTPAYMAPEQARGEAADERADVYGLGALLYHVLSGSPAYGGASPADVLAGVLAGPPPPLETRVPDLPPDLTAIVRKAMMPVPAARYPTGKEMAEDLRRFTTGQLVSAHVYSTGALVRRWLGRHRTTVTVATALVAALAVVGTMSVVGIVRERDRAEAQRLVATAQRRAAEQLVDFLVVEFRDRVRRADRLDLLVGVGEEIAGYYRKLDVSGVPIDHGSLSRRAAALETMAGVEQDKKNVATARTLYEQAIELRERAAAGQVPSASELVQRGESWRHVGTLEDEQGNIAAAMTAYDKAAALADLAVGRDPGAIEGHLLAAASQEQKARTLHFRKGDVQAAYDLSSRARERIASLLRAHPEDARLEVKLASLDQDLHLKELYLGRLDDAARSVDAAIELYGRATRRAPDDAVLARQYAGVFFSLSGVEVARGRLPEALAAMRTHLERYEEIAGKDPDNRATQRDLGWSYASECALERRAQKLDQAMAACGKSERIFRDHVRRDPGSKESQDALVNTLANRALVEAAGDRRHQARRTLLEAVELARRLVASDPDAGRWRDDLAGTLTELGKIEVALGYGRAAGMRSEEALGLAQRLARSSPGDADAESGLAEARILLGDVEVLRGRRKEAALLYETAIGALEAIAARSPGIVFFQVRLARACARLASAVEPEPQGRERAQELRQRALGLLDRLHETRRLYPEDAALRNDVVNAIESPNRSKQHAAGRRRP